MVCRVAQSVAKIVAVAALLSLPVPGLAQETAPVNVTSVVQTAALDFVALGKIATQFSTDCKVSCAAYESRTALRNVRRALREKRPIKVLAIGSSSTVGVGASSPVASYPVRLEAILEGFFKGVDVDVVSRGISGEVARSAAERLKIDVADVRPDLVVWQVGTNDAMARIDEQEFAAVLRGTLRWLRQHRVDIVLIDPQYVERLATDEPYQHIVGIIRDTAKQERALLVNRFQAMADLAKQKGNQVFLATDRFHLNDLGYRCMAEYAARAIVAGVVEAETEQAQPPQTQAQPDQSQPVSQQ
jgi:acyl-CoA thioesterase I